MTYNPTTHSFTSKITPQINPVLKQGSVAMFNGTSSECSLATAIDLTGNWSIEISFAPSVVNVAQTLLSEVVTVPTRRFYISMTSGGALNIQIGTDSPVVVSGALAAGVSYTLYMSYSSTTGIITSKLRTRSTGALADLTDYTVVGLDATTGTWRIGRAPSAGWYSGRINGFYVWKSIKTVAQMDSTKTDAELAIPFCDSVLDIAAKYTVNSANITYENSDYASFYCEEYGFATKTGAIYPKLLSGVGYAGNPSAPYTEYKGLIETKGTINIAAFNLLDTLIDYGGSTGVKAAGLRIAEFTGLDCNDELIYVAEPKLDPAEIVILVPSTGAEVQLDTNFTVSGTSNCSNVKIEASANGVDWTVLSASTTVTAGAFSKADCQLSSDDFDVNDTITLRVSDVDSVSNPDTVTIGTIATITMNEITDVTATVAKTIGGTTNGASVNIYYKLHSAGSWTLAGAGTVDTGTDTWTYSITIPTAGAYDIKVTDGTDSDAYDQQDSIVVASGTLIYGVYYVAGVALVRIYDLAGNLVDSFGTYGTGASELKEPHDIAVDADKIYVCDTGNDKIKIFNRTTYEYIDSISVTDPQGIDVDDASIYVATNWSDCKKYNKSTLAATGTYSQGDMWSCGVGASYLFCATGSNTRILYPVNKSAMTAGTGTYNTGAVDQIWQVSPDADGYIYIANNGNIRKLTYNGTTFGLDSSSAYANIRQIESHGDYIIAGTSTDAKILKKSDYSTVATIGVKACQIYPKT